MRPTTEIRVNEWGDESHESWVLIRANNATVMGGPGDGARLFDSEIAHQHIIMVEVHRCRRKRELNRDWLYESEKLLSLEMSRAQWGAFVSSFGVGNGVPATLRWLTGYGDVPEAPVETRLGDVRESGDRAFESIKSDFDVVEALFEQGAGKKALREAIRSLHYTIENAPKNMEFTAKSLNEHVENVVTKARADIEAMALAAREQETLSEAIEVPALEAGEREDDDEVPPITWQRGPFDG